MAELQALTAAGPGVPAAGGGGGGGGPGVESQLALLEALEENLASERWLLQLFPSVMISIFTPPQLARVRGGRRGRGARAGARAARAHAHSARRPAPRGPAFPGPAQPSAPHARGPGASRCVPHPRAPSPGLLLTPPSSRAPPASPLSPDGRSSPRRGPTRRTSPKPATRCATPSSLTPTRLWRRTATRRSPDADRCRACLCFTFGPALPRAWRRALAAPAGPNAPHPLFAAPGEPTRCLSSLSCLHCPAPGGALVRRPCAAQGAHHTLHTCLAAPDAQSLPLRHFRARAVPPERLAALGARARRSARRQPAGGWQAA
jgi:hypothetical protein